MAKAKGYLGVDLGAGGIKVVQLAQEKKRARLITYGWVERAPLEVGLEWLEDPEATAALLRQICMKARTTLTSVVAALPVHLVFSSVVNISRVPDKELAAAVQWEAKKLIPLPMEDMVLDWKVLPARPLAANATAEEKEKNNSIREVLLTAAPKELRDRYVDVFRRAGLMLASLETESFAFIRSLVGADKSPAVIVDIGARKSNVLIVDRAIPILAHSVDVGGKHFTETIAKVLNISIEKAEAVKHDVATGFPQETGRTFPKILEEVIAPLKNALQYSLGIYRGERSSLPPPERMILTGGSAGLPGIADYFTNLFNIRTFVGDPWARVLYPDDLRPALDVIGPRFSVAIGLAMRDIGTA